MEETSASNNTAATQKKRFTFRTFLKITAWVAGIWAAILVILQVALSSTVLTGIVNRIADEYVDGDVNFGTVQINMFRRFPNIGLRMDEVSVTYPGDRFDIHEAAGPQGELLFQGTGKEADTLVYFERFSASLNILSLATGKISIPHMRLTRPRAFAHSYDDSHRNWDMFRFSTSEEEKDTTGLSVLPPITIGRISLAGKPHIVYTDSKDTVFAMIDVGRAAFNGKLTTRRSRMMSQRTRIGLSLDSIFVAGRIASDTVAFGLNKLYLHEHEDHADVEVNANAMLLTRNYGRISIPMNLKGTAGVHRDSVPVFHVEGMKADIAGIPIAMDAHVRLDEGRTGVEGFIEVSDFRLDGLIKEYGSHLIPELAKVSTDARLTLLAACEGEYIHSTGKLPSFSAVLSIPEAEIKYEGIGLGLNLGIEAETYNDNRDRVKFDLSRLTMRTTGLNLQASASTDDLLGEDPMINLDGRFGASLDTLATFLPDTLGISAEGTLSADLNGSIRLSQMDMYSFSMADIAGGVRTDHISLSIPKDTIRAEIRGLDITVAPETRRSRIDTLSEHRLIGVTAQIADADVSYKDMISANGESLAFSVRNEANGLDDTGQVNRVGGRFSAKSLAVRDSEGMSIEMEETSNSFQMMPQRDNQAVPILSVTSRNGNITVATESNRAIIVDTEISARATMSTLRDSLMRRARGERGRRPATELVEDDFSDRDIKISLDETLLKYFREWNVTGNIDVNKGAVITPYFPLENRLDKFKAHFSNDEVAIDSMLLVTGSSSIAGKGSVSGLRRALTGRRTRPINVDIELISTGMNADELLGAYTAGMNFVPGSLEGGSEMTDTEFFETVTSETAETEGEMSLLVIPSNINADIRLMAENVTYTDLEIGSMTAKLAAKDRCVQITETQAFTNVGEISFNGFYATRSKEDIQVGFDMDLRDITADKVISLMPAVDTIMPLLKSFNGLLNCEVAATAKLDTAMNIIMPSIDGVLRIEGRDLALSGDKTISKLTKILKFKNVEEARIDGMMIEGMIRDNSLEVFPFLIDIDRYTMAMSGTHSLDMSFRYHVSMIKSPLLFRFGVDLYGPDFDNLKFKLGKPKYKNTDLPGFSAEIDEVRAGLSQSIIDIFDKGVDRAVAENMNQDAIEEQKKKINYVEAIDMEMEGLTDEEEAMLENEEQ